MDVSEKIKRAPPAAVWNIFLLLDILPDKADEICLPRFEIIVVPLLDGQSEKTIRASSCLVWNQSFPSPRHCLSAAPSLSDATLLTIREGVLLSATRGRGWSLFWFFNAVLALSSGGFCIVYHCHHHMAGKNLVSVQHCNNVTIITVHSWPGTKNCHTTV